MVQNNSGEGSLGCGKTPSPVILSEAKNLSSISARAKSNQERFFASLRMTVFLFSGSLFGLSALPARPARFGLGMD
jgi:hypothetical protein